MTCVKENQDTEDVRQPLCKRCELSGTDGKLFQILEHFLLVAVRLCALLQRLSRCVRLLFVGAPPSAGAGD